MRKHRIKLSVKSEKDLDKLVYCSLCGIKVKYRDAYFYVDESNIAITNNSKGVCLDCKNKKT